MREWTPEQKQAIEAENGTLLVCAAAGSGKTSVLVERIVRKLTDPAHPTPPESLLVVTFTNAAAAEMRGRIYRRLTQERNADPANETLRALPARLDEMTVCTMDAYCMRLVREHFSACGVEPDFTLIDEGEEAALKTQLAWQTVDEVYQSGENTALTELFNARRDDGALVEGILSLSDFSMSEPDPAEWLSTVAARFIPGPAAESDWGKLIREHVLQGVGYCISLSESALDALREDGFLREKYEDLYTCENAALNELFRQLSVCGWDGISEALTRAGEVFRAGRLPRVNGYTEDPLKLSVQAKRNEIKDVLSGLVKLIPADEAENAEDISVLAPAARQLTQAVLSFNASLAQAKKEKNAYGFSDITHFAVGLLSDPAAPDGKTPLARELSARLAEILIDEYQDTNRVQDTLFTCLSRGGENMFLVGDIKQSIYRFRLASPELFAEKAEAFPLYDPLHPQKKAKILLSRNFRSRRGIADAVNFYFSSLMSKGCGEIDYGEEDALVFGAESYPPADAPDAAFVLLDPGELSSAEAEARYIARLIREQLDGGAAVFEDGETRPANCGDFCILLRAAKGAAEVYAKALTDEGVPVYYDAREGFFETAEIRMALSFLRAADDPLRDLDLLAAMLSPLGLFTPEQAARIRTDHADAGFPRGGPLYPALLFAADNGDAAAKAFLALLERFRMLASTGCADEVLDGLLHGTPLMGAVRAMPGGKLREANLLALYENAAAFCADGDKDLSAYLRYLDMLTENGAELRGGSAGADRNSVSIMTMHGAKGLEYPFVIVAGLTKKFHAPSGGALSVSHVYGLGLKRREREKLKFYDTLSSAALKLSLRREGLSEEMRIYYVALTRAKEKLWLVAAPQNPEKALSRAEALLPGEGRLPPYYVSTASGALQWFLPTALRHPDASDLRSVRRSDSTADFAMTVLFERASQAPPAAPAPAPPAAADEALTQALRMKIHSEYAYLPVCGAPALHTASQLREERFSPAFFGEAVPAFMFKTALTPADVGTATHKFLEACDLALAPLDVPAEIRRLSSLSRLTQPEAESVNVAALDAFFASPLFGRIRSAQALFRERAFTIAKSVRDFDPSLPERFAGEKTVVIGRIDLVFLEDGKAVIVDYKTDRVSELRELPERYRDQLDIYAEAVEKALGYEVKEKLIYSLTLGGAIEC